MRIRVMVTDEQPESFVTKKGTAVHQQVLVCQDMSKDGMRLKQPLCYPMTDEETKKYSTKLRDKFVLLDVSEIQQFGGLLKVRSGALVTAE